MPADLFHKINTLPLPLAPVPTSTPPPHPPKSRISSKFIPQIISPLPTFSPSPSALVQRYCLIPAKSSHNILYCSVEPSYSPQHPVLDLESDSRQKKIKNQKAYFRQKRGEQVKLNTNLHSCFLNLFIRAKLIRSNI
jgi:hypothetical protein